MEWLELVLKYRKGIERKKGFFADVRNEIIMVH